LEAGVLSGYDITTEAAVTKMMFLFAQYSDVEQIRSFIKYSDQGRNKLTFYFYSGFFSNLAALKNKLSIFIY
jgi:hypothetical protein